MTASGLGLLRGRKSGSDGEAGVRVVSRQQWTLELAEEIAAAEAVLFVDCAVAFGAGLVCVADVQASAHSEKIDTHQQGASELLGMARDLYASLPRAAMLLTVGAGSLELGEEFSAAVKAALPEACRLLDETVVRLLA